MIGNILQAELEELIREKKWDELREALSVLEAPDIAEVIVDLPPEDEGIIFRVLPRESAAAAFSYLPLDQQEQLIRSVSSETSRAILDGMTPDDRARLLEEMPAEVTRRIGAWQGLSHMPVVGSFFATESEEEKAKIPRSFVMVDSETELKTAMEVPAYTLPEGTRLRRGTFLPVSAGTKERGIDSIASDPNFHATAYGEHWLRVGFTVLVALIGVVAWGSLAGSMLPFILRSLGFDPATSSAPFVATLVDVTGLIIYFLVAKLILFGAILRTH